MLKEIPKQSFSSSLKLIDAVMGNSVLENVKNFYDFVERLKEYNEDLNS